MVRRTFRPAACRFSTTSAVSIARRSQPTTSWAPSPNTAAATQVIPRETTIPMANDPSSTSNPQIASQMPRRLDITGGDLRALRQHHPEHAHREPRRREEYREDRDDRQRVARPRGAEALGEPEDAE